VNPYHRVFPLRGPCLGGETLSIEVEAVPPPVLERLLAALGTTAAGIRTPGSDEIEGKGQMKEATSDGEVAHRLLNLSDAVLALLDWSSGAAGYLSRLHELGGGEAFTQGTWSVPQELPAPQALAPEVLRRVEAADEALRAGVKALAVIFLLAVAGARATAHCTPLSTERRTSGPGVRPSLQPFGA